MQDQIFPNIAKLSATLASDNARVFRFAEGLVRKLDNLAEAVQREDWQEVGRLCDYMVRSGDTFGQTRISDAARQVCQADIAVWQRFGNTEKGHSLDGYLWPGIARRTSLNLPGHSATMAGLGELPVPRLVGRNYFPTKRYGRYSIPPARAHST